MVFSGTVRSNLDPFGEYGADAILWEAIRDVGLGEQVGRGSAARPARRDAAVQAGCSVGASRRKHSVH